MLTKSDLIKGHFYSARVKRYCGIHGQLNDRLIVRMNGTIIQYDSPTISERQGFQTTSIESFLRWADRDVTLKSTVSTQWRSKYTE